MNALNNSTPPSEDPAVIAEWRRLEAARLAEEREEARDDAEETAHRPVTSPTERRWSLPALLVALAAGIAAALFINRPKPEPVTEQLVTDVQQAAEFLAEDTRTAEVGLEHARARRIASTADVAAEERVVRIGIRDPQGRDRLESLLAASGLRIESDGVPPEEDGETPADGLAVSGHPADVDALLDRLVASPAMLEVVSPALVAVAPGPGGEQPTTADGAAPSGAAERAVSPVRVTLRLEVLEIPAGAPPATSPTLEKSP